MKHLDLLQSENPQGKKVDAGVYSKKSVNYHHFLVLLFTFNRSPVDKKCHRV